jgi:xanthine dehydrogenase molybdopterin-binding subunit B
VVVEVKRIGGGFGGKESAAGKNNNNVPPIGANLMLSKNNIGIKN